MLLSLGYIHFIGDDQFALHGQCIAVRLKFMRAKLWMERSFGILLTLFGIGIAVSTNSTRP